MPRLYVTVRSETLGICTKMVEGIETHVVGWSEPADITHRKYTDDYTDRRARPYEYKGRHFKLLTSAVRAVMKDGIPAA